jgi:hypothetical protein
VARRIGSLGHPRRLVDVDYGHGWLTAGSRPGEKASTFCWMYSLISQESPGTQPRQKARISEPPEAMQRLVEDQAFITDVLAVGAVADVARAEPRMQRPLVQPRYSRVARVVLEVLLYRGRVLRAAPFVGFHTVVAVPRLGSIPERRLRVALAAGSPAARRITATSGSAPATRTARHAPASAASSRRWAGKQARRERRCPLRALHPRSVGVRFLSSGSSGSTDSGWTRSSKMSFEQSKMARIDTRGVAQ